MDTQDYKKAIPKKKSALAVHYDKAADSAPKIVAKGKGAIAEKIIDLAKQNNIPLYEDPDLIEVLSKLDLGAEIPPELYKLIAEVLVYVYKSNNKVGKILK
jgi:flagellar biosynthesis protein